MDHVSYVDGLLTIFFLFTSTILVAYLDNHGSQLVVGICIRKQIACAQVVRKKFVYLEKNYGEISV